MVRKSIFFGLFFLMSFGVVDFVYAKCAIISIPKCGTHLLLKAMKLIQLHITPNEFFLTPNSIMHELLEKEVIIRSHSTYSDNNIEKINKDSSDIVFIYRDPRDHIVSAAFMLKKPHRPSPVHFHWALSSIIDELITGGQSIWGTLLKAQEIRSLHGVADFYGLYLPWQFEPKVYTTQFEKLVGPRGGGNIKDQLSEIIAIAHHMGRSINRDEADAIASKLFGETATFREGKIGSWKKHFLPRHKVAFKTANNGAGQKLLELLGYEKDSNW